MFARRLSLSVVLVFACTRHEPPTATLRGATLPVATDGGTAKTAPADAAPAETRLAWPDAVRVERWDEAWRGMEALPDAEKSLPEVTYARARVAVRRGEYETGIKLLAGLETALPLLATSIAKHRATAELEVGPFNRAGEYFASRSSAASQLRAAKAFERGKDLARARGAADSVLRAEKRTRREEAEARGVRLRTMKEPAREDARWIVIHAPASTVAKEAAEALAKLDPAHPLTADELLEQGVALGDAGRTNEALQAFDATQRAPGKPIDATTRDRARAETLYKSRGHYKEASALYAKCADAGGPRAAEDAFLAGRALSRADDDEAAQRAFSGVLVKYPRSQWAEQASFLSARIHLLHARWDEAALAFDAHTRAFPHRGDERETLRHRALSHLLAKHFKLARQLFEELAADLPDGVASGRALAMSALASERDGDHSHAVARWSEVVRSRPLSWPALVARARLAEVGAPIPPAFERGQGAPPPPPLRPALPPPVDMLHRIGLDDDAEEALRDREGLLGEAAPGRRVEALCQAYAVLGRAGRLYQVAEGVPGQLLTQVLDERTRWAWDCAYPTPYTLDVQAEEAKQALPFGLTYAVMRQESAFFPDVVSPAGAVGLLQLMPDTARRLAAESNAPHDDARLTSPPYNIALGTRYLHDLTARFHGSIPLAVGAYNGGAEAISRWLGRADGMEIDTFVERIPYGETRQYVVRVMGNLARYGYARQGDAGIPLIKLALE